MKKALLNLVVLLFISTVAYSQAVVINSPPSLAGTYIFGLAADGFGPPLTSQIWCGDAVVIKDASANPTQGCDDNILNAADIAGKFVLIDRGTCEFGAKALRGQNAGAIACIIFNHTPGAGVAPMGAGAVGLQVTIPTVMLSYEDGVKIKAALDAGETVNFCIGNIRFPNDMATNSRAGICHAPFGTYPLAWLKATGDYEIAPGASVTNKGQNMGIGVKVNAKMEFTPNGGVSNEFYNATSDPGTVIEVDSTRNIYLSPVDAYGIVKEQGKGSITYIVTSDSTEATPTDNTAVSEFYISNNHLSKARLAANGFDPFITNSYRRSDGTNAEYMTGFTIPYCAGCKIDTILFNMAIAAPGVLADLVAEANLYGWNDLNLDGDATNDELSYLAVGTYTYDSGDIRSSAIARVLLQDFNTGDPGYVIPSDNFGIFVGVRYSGSEATFFGFDEGMDYACDNRIKETAGVLRIDDIPYLGITGYDPNTGVPDIENWFRFTNTTGALAVSVVMSGDQFVGNKQLSDLDAQVNLFPNPAIDKVSVDITLKEPTSKIVYDVLDNTGKLINQFVDKTSGNEFKARLDVQNLSNGLYHLLIKTDKGFKQVSFQVLK